MLLSHSVYAYNLQAQLQAVTTEKQTWRERAEKLEDICETLKLVNRYSTNKSHNFPTCNFSSSQIVISIQTAVF